MDLYIKISFWSCALGAVIRLLLLSFAEYPRRPSTTISRFGDVVGLCVAGGFGFWAAKLLGWV